MSAKLLGSFEEQLLLAILRLDEDASGLSIAEVIKEATGKAVSLSAIYTTLERMKKKGFVKDRLVDGGEDRGNRPKRYFKVEGQGVDALQESRRVRQALAPEGWLGQVG